MFEDYLDRVLRPTVAKLIAREYRDHGDIAKRLVDLEVTETASSAGLNAPELLIGLAALVSEGIVDVSFIEPTLAELRSVGAALARLDMEFLIGELSGQRYKSLVYALWYFAIGGDNARPRPPLCGEEIEEQLDDVIAIHVSVFRAATLVRMLSAYACNKLRRVKEALKDAIVDSVLREALEEELRNLAHKLESIASAKCSVIRIVVSLPLERLGAASADADMLVHLLHVLRDAVKFVRESAQGLESGAGAGALDRAIGLLCSGVRGPWIWSR